MRSFEERSRVLGWEKGSSFSPANAATDAHSGFSDRSEVTGGHVLSFCLRGQARRANVWRTHLDPEQPEFTVEQKKHNFGESTTIYASQWFSRSDVWIHLVLCCSLKIDFLGGERCSIRRVFKTKPQLPVQKGSKYTISEGLLHQNWWALKI